METELKQDGELCQRKRKRVLASFHCLSVFRFMLICYTTLLIITGVMVYHNCATHLFNSNLHQETEHMMMFYFLEFFFLMINLVCYCFGLYILLYDVTNSFLCYAIMIILLTFLRLVISVVYHGEIVALCFETIYSILVLIYRCLYGHLFLSEG